MTTVQDFEALWQAAAHAWAKTKVSDGANNVDAWHTNTLFQAYFSDYGLTVAAGTPAYTATNASVMPKALNTTTADLQSQLQSGKTLADIASAQGVSVDDLVAALVKAAQERIDQAVTDGKLTQERADELSKHLTERITARVNGERPERPAGGHRGDDADTTTTTTTD